MNVLYSILNFEIGASLILMIPGPTNTLLFSAGVSMGSWRALPLVATEALGYVVAISLWGFGLLSMAATLPWLLTVIKLICACYVGLLAVKMWSRGSLFGRDNCRFVQPEDLFLATLTNPKALLFANTVFPIDAFHSSRYFVLVMVCFMIVLLPIGAAWTYLGAALNGSRRLSTYTPAILRLASGVLALFSGSLIYSVCKVWSG